jgi:membrane-associated phospholipid phosphatase
MIQMPPDKETDKIKKQIMLREGINQPLGRLIILTAGLVLFLCLLPSYLRKYFWHGLLTHKVLAGMLLGLCLTAISLVWSAGQRLDAKLFLLFNLRGTRPIWLDRVMSGFTQLGGGLGAFTIALLILAFGRRLLLYQFLLGSITLWLVVESMKFFIHRSRPYIRITETRIVGFQVNGQSFPSGHTSQAFFMAMLFAQTFHSNVWIVVGLYISALMVGLTRMYVGAHYPRDVLAGAIMGSVWGLLGAMINPYVFR